MKRLLNVAGGVLVAGMCSIFLQCEKDIAGSVTETGNVTGKVISKGSDKPVPGARIAVFAKRTEIASADETFDPLKETYADSKGNFSLDMDNGKYTIVASGDEEYAFVDNVVPGSDDAKDMTVSLQHPGSLKGEIVNSLELRGTGSVVTHLIGTDIYQNVDNNGRFLIENIPAGTYTMVSYSTYQPEFSPYYRKVTIYPDSVTDLSTFELNYNGIPIPKGVTVSYDTVHQVVKIEWNAIGEYNDFQEYAVLRGEVSINNHDLGQIAHTKDTVWFDTIEFSNYANRADSLMYEYAVQVTNKLGETGQYYGMYEITAVPSDIVIPDISAGEDQTVGLGSEVKLEGTVQRSIFPIKMTEWKIDDGDWVECERGMVTFNTDSLFGADTLLCCFRVTDSAGHQAVDTTVVYNFPLVTTYGSLPVTAIQGTPTATKFKNKKWYYGWGSNGKVNAWSSEDYTTWQLEKEGIKFGASYQIIVFNNQLIMLKDYRYGLSFRSDNGVDWDTLKTSIDETVKENLDGHEVYYYYFVNSCSYHDTLLSMVNVEMQGDGGDVQMVLFSADGNTWKLYSPDVTEYDYRSKLAMYDDSVFLFGERRYVLKNDRTGWSEVGLWDDDYSESPDGFCDNTYFLSYDSGMVVRYREAPSGSDLIAVSFKGWWTKIQSEIAGNQMSPWVEENKLYWLDAGYVKSLSLH